ncbi:MAG: response regulator transcription factor [Saprospiraceae bacterium]|nr:response regulator transcription factor [Saprospiraceae bacterium]
MIKLFLIDDHPIVVTGIQNAIQEEEDIKVVGTALTATDAIRQLGELTIDLVILDIALPDMDGVELCKHIHKNFPGLKIMVLTTYGQVSFVTAMLRSGAMGYLYKNTSESELVLAIRKVYEGGRYLSEEVNQKLIAKASRTLPKRENFIPRLTRREKEILDLIVAEHTTQEIAAKLFLAPSTIETHRVSLCAKLGARNLAGLVKNAIKLGLV